MVSDGSTRIAAIAVATRDGGTPCGMCLQAIAEFADPGGATPVYLVAESGAVTTYSLAQLLPHGFRSDDVAS
jgi:cytidine deaminase